MNLSYIGIATISSILMGLNVVVSKIGVQHFPPFLFSALRFGSLIPFIIFFPKPKIHSSILMLISVCWGVVYIGGVNYSLSLGVSAGIATILIQSSVFIGFILSWIYLKNPPKREQVIGSIVGFFGICFICYVQEDSGSIEAILVLIVASLSFAVGAIIVKKHNISPFSLAIWINAYSAVPVLILSILSGEDFIFPLIFASSYDWKIVLLSGWISTFMGSFCWLYVIQKCDLNLVMPFRFLVPVFGSLFAMIIFDEVYSITTWVGGMLVLVGLGITHIYPLIIKMKQKKEVKNV